MEYTTAFEQVVAWGDMDAFGHVNNTIYLRYFESARVRYFDAVPELAGFQGTEIPVLANIACSFKKPVVYPDMLTVKVGVESMGRASLKMTCEMHSPKVGLAAVAECTIVIINGKTGRSVRIPELWRTAIERIEQRSFEL
jgi:acyl-CoA thioester hydrolase